MPPRYRVGKGLCSIPFVKIHQMELTMSKHVGGDMTASNLANAPPGMQKQMLGEKIFPCSALRTRGGGPTFSEVDF